MPTPHPSVPLSDAEHEELEELLEACSPYDYDGLLGVLDAVVVAPSVVPPSAWLALILPNGFAAAPTIDPRRAMGIVMRLFNECAAALDDRQICAPDPEDEEACASFAAGYADGAALDPAWVEDANRWTFAAHLAYLGGRLHLVPEETKSEIEAGEPDPKRHIRKFMLAIVGEAHRAFKAARAAALSPPRPRAMPRVGRNEPCPCGSGKKYKRCCLA